MKTPTAIARSRIREVHHRKIHEDVTEYLLQDIRNGTYGVGSELPSERALMAEFGVGRPAVRESLAKLARMGLIEVRPGLRAKVRTATVAPLLKEMDAAVKISLSTEEGQRHMQELRLIFESAVARHVAPHATEQQLAKLRKIQETCREALGSTERFAALDVAFHRAVGEISGNPLVTAAFDAFCAWLLEQRLSNLRRPGRMEKTLEAHGRILAALEKNDPDAAESAVLAHLSDVNTIFWSASSPETPPQTRPKRR